jgi:hypothetical protein
MQRIAWILREPLTVLESVDEPYLETAKGSLGGHEIGLQFAPATPDLRVFLDGGAVFELGMPAPAGPWFKLCREQGFVPEAHWDLDPALILFRQVVPALARGWQEPLPFNDLGIPDGVVCLATVQAAWVSAVNGLSGRKDPMSRQVASCFDNLPLRAVVFHDDPSRREDFVGTGVDEPLMGVYLHLGASRSRVVTLSKATVVATGGLKMSPWEMGGEWTEDGREYRGTLRPGAFLWAAGLGRDEPEGFEPAFDEALRSVLGIVDPAVDAYRTAWPTGVLWHRDPLARYLNHMIVDVRMEDGKALLTLDDGTDVAVAELKSGSVCVP